MGLSGARGLLINEKTWSLKSRVRLPLKVSQVWDFWSFGFSLFLHHKVFLDISYLGTEKSIFGVHFAAKSSLCMQVSLFLKDNFFMRWGKKLKLFRSLLSRFLRTIQDVYFCLLTYFKTSSKKWNVCVGYENANAEHTYKEHKLTLCMHIRNLLRMLSIILIYLRKRKNHELN